jgi:hypothetical protein
MKKKKVIWCAGFGCIDRMRLGQAENGQNNRTTEQQKLTQTSNATTQRRKRKPQREKNTKIQK